MAEGRTRPRERKNWGISPHRQPRSRRLPRDALCTGASVSGQCSACAAGSVAGDKTMGPDVRRLGLFARKDDGTATDTDYCKGHHAEDAEERSKGEQMAA
jgi:cytochrome c2